MTTSSYLILKLMYFCIDLHFISGINSGVTELVEPSRKLLLLVLYFIVRKQGSYVTKCSSPCIPVIFAKA